MLPVKYPTCLHCFISLNRMFSYVFIVQRTFVNGQIAFFMLNIMLDKLDTWNTYVSLWDIHDLSGWNTLKLSCVLSRPVIAQWWDFVQRISRRGPRLGAGGHQSRPKEGNSWLVDRTSNFLWIGWSNFDFFMDWLIELWFFYGLVDRTLIFLWIGWSNFEFSMDWNDWNDRIMNYDIIATPD